MKSRRLTVLGSMIILGGITSILPAQTTDEGSASPAAPSTQQPAAAAANSSGYQFPDARQRFKTYANNTFGLVPLLYVPGRALIAQWWEDPEEWEQSGEGFAKRMASTFGLGVIKNTTAYGLDELFKQDSQYYRCQCEGFFPRVGHAMKSTLTAHTRSGRVIPSVPWLAANYASEVAVVYAWYPDRYSYKDGIRYGHWSLLGRFGFNFFREFILRR